MIPPVCVRYWLKLAFLLTLHIRRSDYDYRHYDETVESYNGCIAGWRSMGISDVWHEVRVPNAAPTGIFGA